MKKFRVASFGFRVRRLAQLVHNSQLATRNSQLFALAAMAVAWPFNGIAQTMNDPTRPPAAVSPDAPGEPGAAAPGLLQSVMITPTERTAIIGGERIKLGGKYGEARVVKITESEVVLHSANGPEILRMYPDVSMKPIEPEQPAGKKPAAKHRPPIAATGGKQK